MSWEPTAVGGGNNTPVQPEDPDEDISAVPAGLYDADDVMLASWDELVEDYGLDLASNYIYTTYQTTAGSMYYVLENNEKLSSGKKLVIGENVTGIGDNAIRNCNSLTSIVIPNCVVSIGDNAFLRCESLTNITIPDGVLDIGENAFYNCYCLSSVYLPDSVVSIGNEAFMGCSSLANISFPDGLNSIGDGAFQNCTSLTSVSLPNSVASIGNHAFIDCSSLASVSLPDSVSIGDLAFFRCPGLSSFTIPKGASIGSSIIGGCSFMQTIFVAEGNTNYTVEDNVLFTSDMSNLKAYLPRETDSYSIPDSVTSIDAYAFYASNLTSITIPNGVTRIKQCTFTGCTSLASVYIPESVTSIEQTAFSSCAKVKSINYAGSKADWSKIDFGKRWNYAMGYYHVYCSDDSLFEYGGYN